MLDQLTHALNAAADLIFGVDKLLVGWLVGVWAFTIGRLWFQRKP